MAAMIAEDAGEVPLSVAHAAERLPQAMSDLGYDPAGERLWKRRRPSALPFLSLPDRCPTTLRVTLHDATPAGEGADPRAGVRLTYTARLPGQLLAHSDAAALQLETDRLLARLAGHPLPDTARERRRLARLTVVANVLLSAIPAAFMAGALWAARERLMALPVERAVGITLLLGVAVWGVAMVVTARGVVGWLNRRVTTRVRYRKA